MKVLVGGWFSLPRMGREVFSQLMRCGVEYDKGMGFRMSAQTDIESAVAIIGSAVGEKVDVSVRCFICGLVACPGCPYLDSCDRRRVSPLCLCHEHASAGDAYDSYKLAFSENLKV